MSNDAAGFACAADRSVAPPTGLSTLGFDPTRFQTEPPACYRASWQLPGPDSHRQATTSLRTLWSPTRGHLQFRWTHERSRLGVSGSETEVCCTELHQLVSSREARLS